MPSNAVSETDKLKLIYSAARDEIGYRRQRDQQIFGWSSAILVAITSTLLLSEVKAGSPISSIQGKAVATAMLMLVTLGSAIWQMKQKRLLAEVQRVVSRAMDQMGVLDLKLYSDGSPISPTKWKEWGDRSHSWLYHFFNPGKIQTTCLLGLAAVVTVWLR